MKGEYLSKREQQIMEAVYRLGRATAVQVAASFRARRPSRRRGPS